MMLLINCQRHNIINESFIKATPFFVDYQRCSGGPRSTEACQEELGATTEHGHARNLSETDPPGEIEGEAPWSDVDVGVEIGVGQLKRRRVTSDEASATSQKETNGQANVDGIGAGEVELQPDGLALCDGTGIDEVNRKAVAVGGTSSAESPFVEAAQEDLRAKAIVEGAERVTRDAVEVKRKAESVRARHAEKARRRAEKLGRRASRNARRLKKLQDRESRAQRKGEGLNPPVERMMQPVRLERDAVVEDGGEGVARQGVEDDVHAAEVSQPYGDIRTVGARKHAQIVVSKHLERETVCITNRIIARGLCICL